MASKRRGPYGKRKYDAETIEGSNEGLTVLNETICKYEERLSRSDQNRPPSGPKNTPVTTNEEYAGCSYETKENLMGGNEIDVMDIEQEDIQSDSESIIYTHDLPESETLPLFGDENDLDNQSYDTADMNLNVDQLDLDSEPLYPGASVTVGAIMLLLAVFCTSNNLSGESIQQLLSIFAVTLPNGHRLCSSLNGFKNFFRNLKNPIVKHYYCGYCLGFIADASAVNCPYGKCYRPLSENLEYFLEMPVDEQLKGLFSQKGYYNAVQERFVRENERTYRDIFDGKLYQSYVENNGPLSSPDNISFTFNTDGASVFRSSNTSVWPLFLVINELPYRLRMKRDNMILAGLWFGNKKPSMGTFLQPFLEKFKEFEKGFHIYSPERGDFLMKAFIICGTADLPARCLLCNGIQYNGSFSCWKCIQSGETAKKGGGHCHVFPFIEENPKLPERSKQSVLVDSKLALDKQDAGIRKYTVNGVKGPSWLSFFPKFNIVDGIAIDYMHGVLLGVQKLLLELWFSASHKGKPYSYADQVCEADRRLLSIKPTLNISRLPRSIQNELKYWKASEYRSFLLYYGAVVLKGILDQERFVHYLYFVNAIHILLKFDASLTEINRADILLLEFVKLFSRHYGKCFMTLNLHQLVHLADSVRTLGPLYTHSCFPFEDKNGVLLKMIRGTQNIDSQIITGVSFLQKLPELKRKTIEKDSELEQLYISIECPNILKRGLKIDSGIYVLGALHTRSLTEGEHFSLCTSIGYDVPHEKVQSFKRLELHEDLIYGTSYSRMNKRDNSVICYKKMSDDLTSEFFGRVKDFVIIEENSDLKFNVFAIVEELQCRYENGSFITSVEKTEQVNAVPLMSVLGSCMLISYTSKSNSEVMYVCKFPNKLESD